QTRRALLGRVKQKVHDRSVDEGDLNGAACGPVSAPHVSSVAAEALRPARCVPTTALAPVERRRSVPKLPEPIATNPRLVRIERAPAKLAASSQAVDAVRRCYPSCKFPSIPSPCQRMPASISGTSLSIDAGVTTPAPVLSAMPGIRYFFDSTHCSTGMKPC